MTRRSIMLWVLGFLISVAAAVEAKDIEITISRTENPPALDGILNDEVWRNVEPIRGFMQYNPDEGAQPSERTELYIVYDNDNIYLAFKCFDSEIEKIRATMTQRENWDDDDCVGFGFDTYNSEREAFLFNLNPYGIPSDFIWNVGGYCDNGWDADLISKGKIHDDHYCIEVAVPFHSLRMPAKEEQEWGFYALRSIMRRSEMDIWPPRTHKISNNLAQASVLRGISGVKTGRHFAVLPYVFSSHTRHVEKDSITAEAGFDFRYGITSNFMLDVTVNPDYSQIEADPDRIELSERYTRWLPEKRPFFTEGTDIFTSNQALFYSRAITNPAAGMKLTGRMGRTRIGVLSAIDQKDDSGKESYFNHLRVKTAVMDESSFGFLMTNKDDPDDGTYNRVLSLDGMLRLRRLYSLKSQISRSYTRNDSTTYEATGYNLNLERFGANSYNSLWYDDFPEEFEAQSGSMWEVLGYKTIGTHHGFFLRKPFESINEIEFHAEGSGRYDQNNNLKEEYFSASSEMSVDGLWTKLEFFKNHEQVNGHDFRYQGLEHELWCTPSRYLDQYFSVICGSAPHYEEGFTGWKYRVVYGAAIKPTRRIVCNIDFSREDLYDKFRGKRAQIAVILWTRPLIFAVDEPTNHLDAEARHLLATALQSFHGIGLLVSHDRELLDTLCRQCLFIDPPEAILRPGGYSDGAAQARQEALSAQKQYAIASHAQTRLKREMARRRELAARANRRRSVWIESYGFRTS